MGDLNNFVVAISVSFEVLACLAFLALLFRDRGRVFVVTVSATKPVPVREERGEMALGFLVMGVVFDSATP